MRRQQFNPPKKDSRVDKFVKMLHAWKKQKRKLKIEYNTMYIKSVTLGNTYSERIRFQEAKDRLDYARFLETLSEAVSGYRMILNIKHQAKEVLREYANFLGTHM